MFNVLLFWTFLFPTELCTFALQFHASIVHVYVLVTYNMKAKNFLSVVSCSVFLCFSMKRNEQKKNNNKEMKSEHLIKPQLITNSFVISVLWAWCFFCRWVPFCTCTWMCMKFTSQPSLNCCVTGSERSHLHKGWNCCQWWWNGRGWCFHWKWTDKVRNELQNCSYI